LVRKEGRRKAFFNYFRVNAPKFNLQIQLCIFKKLSPIKKKTGQRKVDRNFKFNLRKAKEVKNHASFFGNPISSNF